jgi:tetratricopeptide (TPR) repeat protein
VAKILNRREFLLELASLKLWLVEYIIMKHTPLFMLLFALFAAPSLPAMAASASEVQEINGLIKQGQLPSALDRANAAIAQNPQDAQARFLKGLILTEQNKSTEAIKVFTALTDDFPELPEPYNNLAVLYAAQGQYDKARSALEMAIRTHPSYATAHENLGDIYAKMASVAYDKALQLDTRNTSAQTKLSMIRELFSGNRKPTLLAKASNNQTKLPVSSKPSVALKPVVAAVVPPAAKPEPTPKPVKEASKPVENPDSAAVTAAVESWAAAWSRRDADAYLGAYSAKFKTPGGESHTSWESSRRERITAPKKIVVKLSDIRINELGNNRAQASFHQSYRSDKLTSSTHKVLELVKSGSGWQIVEERNR